MCSGTRHFAVGQTKKVSATLERFLVRSLTATSGDTRNLLETTYATPPKTFGTKPMNELPPGVTRSKDISQDATLDDCFAVKFDLEGAQDNGTSSLIVWRDGPKNIRPIESKRLRDLRPGDYVQSFGKRKRVLAIEIYR
jgi:hypothetical protein